MKFTKLTDRVLSSNRNTQCIEFINTNDRTNTLILDWEVIQSGFPGK
jgi:hypothetical protein